MRFSSRARRLAMVGLTLCVAVPAGATSVLADEPAQPVAVPTTLPPLPSGTAAPPPPVSPTGAATTMPVVDDMRTLTIEVPAAWSDVSTVPGTGTDNSSYPQIIASPNVASFQSSFDTSGVLYIAQPFNTDTAAGLKAGFDFTGQCTDGGTQPYADAYFTGTMQNWTACGGGQAKVVTVFANPMDQRFSVLLLVGIATPADEDALALALASFFVTKPQGGVQGGVPGGGSTGGTTIPGVVTPGAGVPSVPGPTPTTVAGVVPTAGSVAPAGNAGDPVILEDDTKTIGVGVPAAWVQVNTSPASDAQNNQVPAISAAPDLAAFNSGQGVGMFMVAAPYSADLQSVLTTMAPQGCQGAAVTPYQDEFFSGFTQTFQNCGGLTVTLLAANRTGNTARTIQIIAATTPGDDSPLQIIGSTFDLTPEAR